jgi:hypothetical protein
LSTATAESKPAPHLISSAALRPEATLSAASAAIAAKTRYKNKNASYDLMPLLKLKYFESLLVFLKKLFINYALLIKKSAKTLKI